MHLVEFYSCHICYVLSILSSQYVVQGLNSSVASAELQQTQQVLSRTPTPGMMGFALPAKSCSEPLRVPMFVPLVYVKLRHTVIITAMPGGSLSPL